MKAVIVLLCMLLLVTEFCQVTESLTFSQLSDAVQASTNEDSKYFKTCRKGFTVKRFKTGCPIYFDLYKVYTFDLKSGSKFCTLYLLLPGKFEIYNLIDSRRKHLGINSVAYIFKETNIFWKIFPKESMIL